MRTGIAIGLLIAAGVIALGSAWIVRDGLLAIAHEIRDKPLPQLPDTVNLRAVTIEHATIDAPAGKLSPDGQSPMNVKITIENLRLESLMPELPKPGKPAE